MKTCWITNISKNIISVGDLGFTIQPYQSINLLDKHHYSFTDEQLKRSFSSGSLYKRSDKIVVRKLPPSQSNLKGPSNIGLNENNEFPSKIRSILEHKEFNYDELEMSDDEYARENADFADEDDVGKYKKD